jgi:hypothetical protein
MAANEWPHGAHTSDERQRHILQAAKARLRGNPDLARANVSCAYFQGVLTLRGALSSSYLKELAQEAVGHVEGVERIENRIRVIAPPHREIATGDAPEAGHVDADAQPAAGRPPLEAPGQQTVVRPAPTPERLWTWYQVLGGLITCGAISPVEAESILSHSLAAETSPRELVERIRAAVSPTLEMAKSSESIFFYSSVGLNLTPEQYPCAETPPGNERRAVGADGQ